MGEALIGKKAPDFLLPTVGGAQISLSQFSGQKVVLYFYPKDNTPACSKQAKQFAEKYEAFTQENGVILGISRDNLSSHEKFIEKLGLPFLLLSDTDESVCKMYDVMKEKNMYGKKVTGIERSTFIINESGEFTQIFRKVKVDGHTAQILEILKNM